MSAALADLILTKGEAAAELNVSPGRISQYISEGKIYGAAIVGEGRSARINVTVARQQLRAGIDIGQRLGNGINTRLADPVEDVPPASDESSASQRVQYRPAADPIEEAIKSERLRGIQFANRQKAEEELARRGTYTRASDVAAAMATLAGGMMNAFEGGLADFATAIAGRFELSQRDVLHVLRTEFVSVRQKAADGARRKGADMPAVVPDEVAPDEE